MKRTWTIIGVRDVSASTGTSRCSASLRRLQPMPTLGKFSTRMELSCFASTRGEPTSRRADFAAARQSRNAIAGQLLVKGCHL